MTLFVTQPIPNLNYVVAFQLYSASVAVATISKKVPLQHKNAHLFCKGTELAWTRECTAVCVCFQIAMEEGFSLLTDLRNIIEKPSFQACPLWHWLPEMLECPQWQSKIFIRYWQQIETQKTVSTWSKRHLGSSLEKRADLILNILNKWNWICADFCVV